MNDKQDDKGNDAIRLVDLGPVTELTKGSVYITPWFEQTPPPFNYLCPVC